MRVCVWCRWVVWIHYMIWCIALVGGHIILIVCMLQVLYFGSADQKDQSSPNITHRARTSSRFHTSTTYTTTPLTHHTAIWVPSSCCCPQTHTCCSLLEHSQLHSAHHRSPSRKGVPRAPADCNDGTDPSYTNHAMVGSGVRCPHNGQHVAVLPTLERERIP